MFAETSEEGLAFMRVISETPDDPAPRLVFADWLDEQGESDRAEYIRLAIEIEPRLTKAGYLRGPHTPAEVKQITRYSKLHRDYTKNVGYALRAYHAYDIATFRLRGGFLDSVSLPAIDYTRCARNLVQKTLQPIRKWVITDVEFQQINPGAHGGWIINTKVPANPSHFGYGITGLILHTPSVGEGGWPTRGWAEEEFAKMLVEWAKGVDEPNYHVSCRACNGGGLFAGDTMRAKTRGGGIIEANGFLIACRSCEGTGGRPAFGKPWGSRPTTRPVPVRA